MAQTFASKELEDEILKALIGRMEMQQDLKKLKTTNPAKYKEYIFNEMRACHNDCVYFIQNYLYTDKNKNLFSDRIGTLVPYLLFPYQVETVDKLVASVFNKKNVFIEKSRQMGISWTTCAVALWGWLFHDWKIHFISQKEDYVDKIGDMQSLFQKIRFMTAELPKWMMPKDFSIDKHMPRLRIYKPKGSGTGVISGESANKNSGTGGTYDLVFFDEMSKTQNARDINMSIGATTGCIVYNSTPLGKFNEYYRMRCIAVQGGMEYIKLHWSKHPCYTKEWYEWRVRGKSKEWIAQELEINYEASVTGRVYPRFAHIPMGDCIFGKYDYDPYLPLYCAIDNSHGGNDNHAIILMQTTPNGKIRIIDSHEFPSRTTIDECASLLARVPIGTHSDESLEFLARLNNYKTPIFIADPYDSKSTWNDTSIIKIYRAYGIALTLPERSKPVQERIRVCQMNMGRVEVNIDTESSNSLNWGLVSAIQNARYPERDETSQSTGVNHNPVHDQTSHYRTAFEYGVNRIIEMEESNGIIGGFRQKEPEKTMVQKKNYVTGEIYWVSE